MRTGKRPTAVAAALVAAAVLTAALGTGCGDRVKAEVKELLEEAREHHRKSVEAIRELDDFNKKWEELLEGEQTPETIPEARSLILAAQKSVETANSELKDMEGILLKVEGKDVSKEMKTYCGMKVEALREQEKWLEVGLQAMQVRLQIIDDYEAGATPQQLLEERERLDRLEQEAQQHAKKAQAMHQDANDYYEEKKIGG